MHIKNHDLNCLIPRKTKDLDKQISKIYDINWSLMSSPIKLKFIVGQLKISSHSNCPLQKNLKSLFSDLIKMIF